MDRIARVEAYIKDGSGSLRELLDECVKDGGLEGCIACRACSRTRTGDTPLMGI